MTSNMPNISQDTLYIYIINALSGCQLASPQRDFFRLGSSGGGGGGACQATESKLWI